MIISCSTNNHRSRGAAQARGYSSPARWLRCAGGAARRRRPCAHRGKQGSLKQSASAPRVHKQCQCENGKLCMRAMKRNVRGNDCDNCTTREVKMIINGSRGQNAK
eukprot:6214252-Pleurochrysis_carterae.AAC.3